MKFRLAQHPSRIIVFAMDMIPLAGVVFLDWDVFGIMAVYWLDLALLGLLNVVKMVVWARRHDPKVSPILIIFGHVPLYVLVMAAYGVVVVGLFGSPADWHGQALFMDNVFAEVMAIPGIIATFIGMAAGHLASFCLDFMQGGGIDRTSGRKLQAAPVGNVLLLHAALCSGAVGIALTGSNKWAAVLLTILKAMGNFTAQRRKHLASGSDKAAEV